ncbi:hypothetical protein [Actinomadura rugatobispora]|uniref:Alpha/beta hydrolase n=1 Tax=Actinomadura rugatobispora TaxID=1994 RepID=A0ABW1A0L8_9ACTN
MTKNTFRNASRRAGTALLGAGLALTAVPTAAAALTSPERPPAAPGKKADPRGTVVSATRVAHMSGDEAGRYLTAISPDFGTPAPRHGVDTYRVVYRTISATGAPTTASGVVSLPARTAGRTLRAVSYAHGTHASRDMAGSVDEQGQSRVAAIYYAAAGYAGVAPDYLGLGLGPGHHPYMDAASEASASLDMLRAARAVAASHGRVLNPRVLVTGFSQGGHAAMALGRELQNGADRHLRLGALAPISGPYDIRDAQIPASLSEDGPLAPRASVFYLSYVSVAWNRLHHIYDSPSQVFNAPHDKAVEGLFNGTTGEEEIVTRLPGTIRELATPRYLRQLEHPSGALLRAIRSADGTCDWRPRVPVRIYGASGDEHVAFANARSCARTLRAHGARPQVVDYGPDAGHDATVFKGLPDTLRWFQALGR